MTLSVRDEARFAKSPRRTRLQQHHSALHGARTHLSVMIEGNNKNCTAGKDDIWGTSRPRDVRLQIYISLTLGILAFLTFCASLHIAA